MIVTPDAVAAAFKTVWDADAQLVALVPGGLNWGRVPETKLTAAVRMPWAWIMVTEQAPQFSSGDTIQIFAVEIRVWSKAGATLAGTTQQRVDAVFSRERASTDIIVSGANTTGQPSTIDLVPGPCEMTEDDKEIQQSSVLSLARKWDLWVQVER